MAQFANCIICGVLSARLSEFQKYFLTFLSRFAVWIVQPLLKLRWIISQIKEIFAGFGNAILARFLLPVAAGRPNVKRILVTNDDMKESARVVASREIALPWPRLEPRREATV